HDARAHVDALADVALAADARALADLGVMPHPRPGRDASVARDDGGVGDRCRTRLRLRRRHARTASGRYATRAPPERSERIPASSPRTTRRPPVASLRGFLP